MQKFLKDVKVILQNCREYNEEVEGEQGQAEFIELSNLMEKQAEELCSKVSACFEWHGRCIDMRPWS